MRRVKCGICQGTGILYMTPERSREPNGIRREEPVPCKHCDGDGWHYAEGPELLPECHCEACRNGADECCTEEQE